MYQVFLASEPINDHFMNVAWGREILRGRLPVRDFFEAGEPLSELLSASAEAVVGYRLLSEAVVVGLASAASVCLIFGVTYGLTRAVLPPVLASTLVILAGTRSYSYPKVVIYAGAAALIWKYVNQPSRAWLVTLAGWTGVAFLWRHDHGFYMALATTATVAVVHGATRTMVTRLAYAGFVALIVTAPYLAWVQVHRGIVQYLSDGIVVILSEFDDNPPTILPPWPLHGVSDVIGFAEAETFAPTIGIRWDASSTRGERDDTIRRFGLVAPRALGPDHIAVRVPDPTPHHIQLLLNDPHVADTDGLDRSTSQVLWSAWGPLDRARFHVKGLRLRLVPAFDDTESAGQIAKWMFMALAAGTIVWALLPRRTTDSRNAASRKALGLIAGLLLVSMPGLLRLPLSAYAADPIALPSVIASWAIWMIWRRRTGASGPVRLLTAVGVGAFTALLILAVCGVGLVARRAPLLADPGAWTQAWKELSTTPPINVAKDEPPNSTIGLARYIRSCTEADAPLLVLAFAPDLQYYADRHLASRHLLLGPGRWTRTVDQQASVDRLRRSPPPIVVAERPFYDKEFPNLYPVLAGYVRAEYRTQGEIVDRKDHRYSVLTRNGLAPMRTDPEHGWPCFTPDR